MARSVVKMPKVSDTDNEVVVLEWLGQVGATVEAGGPLVVVESSKATIEVPSPVSGTVSEHLVAIDDEVGAGTPICVIET